MIYILPCLLRILGDVVIFIIKNNKLHCGMVFAQYCVQINFLTFFKIRRNPIFEKIGFLYSTFSQILLQ